MEQVKALNNSVILDVERNNTLMPLERHWAHCCRLIVERHPNPDCPTLQSDAVGDFFFFHGFSKYGASHNVEPSGSYLLDRTAFGCKIGDLLIPIIVSYDHLEAIDTRDFSQDQLDNLNFEGYYRVQKEDLESIFAKQTSFDTIVNTIVSHANQIAYELSAYIAGRVVQITLVDDTGKINHADNPVYAPPPFHHSFQNYPNDWLRNAVSKEFGEEYSKLFASDIDKLEESYRMGYTKDEVDDEEISEDIAVGPML